MSENIKFKKISDIIYEIPKTGKMKVPCRIFASEKLMELMKKDQTLTQGSNVATLPGIYKHSLIMPDGHQGYGFCIGGVAAIDAKKGVISPGGIGYDINCLIKDSKVLTEFGYTKKIQDFENSFVEVENHNSNYILKSRLSKLAVVSFESKLKHFSSKGINYFMKKKHSGSVIKIKTKLGYNLIATKEHPILTDVGMVDIGNLVKGEKIAINPFEGVEYNEIIQFPEIDKTLFSKEEQRQLIKRNLLELNSDNLPILTKLFGYLIGDGSIYLSGVKGFVNAYGSKDDLELIKQDFSKLGFSAQIYGRVRDHAIETQYGLKEFSNETFELHVSSKSLAKLFFALGYPEGTKTNTKYLVPAWIMQSPKWIKRLFLSGLFGAELSSPRTHTKTGFDCPVLSMNKNSHLVDNGREFIIQILKLLNEFNVKVNKITERSEYKNRFGKTCRIRLQISSQENNLLNLWSKIGFSYNLKRKNLANVAILYIREKKQINSKRFELDKKIKELKNSGLKLKEVQDMLECSFANKRFIERHYYENVGSRISLDFESFDNYKLRKILDLEKRGVMFDIVDTIIVENYDGFVYDFNVEETHNFVANNIVVSNCGVRLMRTDLKVEEVKSKIPEITQAIFDSVPAGLGGSNIRVTDDVLNEILDNGAKWAVKNGYGNQQDLDNCEEGGSMDSADHNKVSQKARSRGRKQIATLGSGNHFLEIQTVDEIFDSDIASTFGVTEIGQVVVMIHCGSRGLGHQVCSDYLREMERQQPEIVKELVDRELIYAPSGSDLANDYFAAMSAAANFAWCNRHVIGHQVRTALLKVFPEAKIETLYDVAHNIAKLEEHTIDGEKIKAYVHRKGATRAFAPGRKEVPLAYREVGQPILLPGSMGTSSYVLVGTEKAMTETFGSTAHGAGRVMSRHQALKTFKGSEVQDSLEKSGIHVRGTSMKGLAEEAPGVYKDIDEVVKVSHDAGIGKLVFKVKPLSVIKG